MKKIAMLILAAASASSFAATALTFEATTTLSTAECEYVGSDGAKVTLSKNVVGAYDCNATGAAVAVANVKGKGKVFAASSEGGKIAETGGTTTFADQSAAQSAADAQAVAPTAGGSGT